MQRDSEEGIHKPHTTCIAKGKADHMYEFGNKVGLVSTANSQVILAIMDFPNNPNDSTIMQPLLEQMLGNGLKLPEWMAYDRGGRGSKEIHDVKIITPGKPKQDDTPYERAKKRHYPWSLLNLFDMGRIRFFLVLHQIPFITHQTFSHQTDEFA